MSSSISPHPSCTPLTPVTPQAPRSGRAARADTPTPASPGGGTRDGWQEASAEVEETVDDDEATVSTSQSQAPQPRKRSVKKKKPPPSPRKHAQARHGDGNQPVDSADDNKDDSINSLASVHVEEGESEAPTPLPPHSHPPKQHTEVQPTELNLENSLRLAFLTFIVAVMPEVDDD